MDITKRVVLRFKSFKGIRLFMQCRVGAFKSLPRLGLPRGGQELTGTRCFCMRADETLEHVMFECEVHKSRPKWSTVVESRSRPHVTLAFRSASSSDQLVFLLGGPFLLPDGTEALASSGLLRVVIEFLDSVAKKRNPGLLDLHKACQH